MIQFTPKVIYSIVNSRKDCRQGHLHRCAYVGDSVYVYLCCDGERSYKKLSIYLGKLKRSLGDRDLLALGTIWADCPDVSLRNAVRSIGDRYASQVNRQERLLSHYGFEADGIMSASIEFGVVNASGNHEEWALILKRKSDIYGKQMIVASLMRGTVEYQYSIHHDDMVRAAREMTETILNMIPVGDVLAKRMMLPRGMRELLIENESTDAICEEPMRRSIC